MQLKTPGPMKKLSLVALLFMLPICAMGQSKAWPRQAVDKIMANDMSGVTLAVDMLRAQHDYLAPSDIDALADELARIITDGTLRQAQLAGDALRRAAKTYDRASEVLVKAYEKIDGTDFLKEASILTDIVLAGGEDYVRNIFQTSTKPPEACSLSHSTDLPQEKRCPFHEDAWCMSADVLLKIEHGLPGTLTKPAPDPDEVLPHCFGAVKEGGIWYVRVD